MELLFASQNAPPLPETDPELRRALLDSLKTFEEQEARRPAFTHEPRVSVPEPASRGVLLVEQAPHHSHAWLSQSTRLCKVVLLLPVVYLPWTASHLSCAILRTFFKDSWRREYLESILLSVDRAVRAGSAGTGAAGCITCA